MKKNWKALAPLVLGTAGAIAAGLAVLLRKPEDPAAPAAGKDAPAAKKAAVLKTGNYSFISGFKDAATVELRLDYDPEKFTYAVVEEDFLNYSSDSHVAILYGEEFNLQLEYAGYYSGEDFASHQAGLAEKYQNFGTLRCGAVEGVWVLDGDNVVIHLPIPDDAHSYLLITVQKTSAYDDEVTTLPDYAPLRELLGTIRFARS